LNAALAVELDTVLVITAEFELVEWAQAEGDFDAFACGLVGGVALELFGTDLEFVDGGLVGGLFCEGLG
jgi:hypothetical protein